jgi:P-type E1-E2 ATPase
VREWEAENSLSFPDVSDPEITESWFDPVLRVWTCKGQDGSVIMKGAPEFIYDTCGSERPATLNHLAAEGVRLIGVCRGARVLGVFGFEDPIRPEAPEAIKACTELRVRVVSPHFLSE